MSINFNNAPYFDDYDEDKKFVKILYRPGYAVQTRELNQLQTQIQAQIDRFGQGIYKDGSMVIPGGISYNRNFSFVKLSNDINSVQVFDGSELLTEFVTENVEAVILSLVGQPIVGQSSGVTGVVKWYQLETDESPLTLYVEYDSSGDDNESKTFFDGEQLIVRVPGENEETYTDYTLTATAEEATGFGSAAEIERGVYFVKGYFLLIEKQTLILDPYTNNPSYSVGFRIRENIITPEQDSSLNDNANGSFNFAAPGAHRHRIELTLEKIPLDQLDELDNDSYIELLQTDEGENLRHETRSVYSEIGKELARRTYDESGDYTVSAFRMNAIEGRNNDRGDWAPATSYLIGDVVTSDGKTYVATLAALSGNIPPTHNQGEASDGSIIWSYTDRPQYNNGHIIDGREDQVYIAIEPGKAYVQGYEIEKPSTTYVPIDKARTFEQIDNDVIRTEIGNFIRVRNVLGVANITGFVQVDLKRSNGDTVGTARIRNIERFGASDFNLYLFDVRMTNDSFNIDRDVKIISNSDFSCVVSNMNTADGRGNITTSSSTVNGAGTRFTVDFKVNDFIDINDEFYRISAISNDRQMTVVGTPNVTANAYRIHRTFIQSPSRLISIFPLGRSFVKSVKDETPGVNAPDTRYVVVQRVTKTIGGTTLTVSLSEVVGLTGTGSEIFARPQDIILFDNFKSGQTLTPFIPVTSSNSTITDTTIEVTGLTAGRTYTIFFPVVKNTPATASPKTKTLVRNFLVEKSDAGEYEQRVIPLGKADVYRIRKIEMEGPESTVIDITDYYDLDDGQRDTHYDVGRIVRKPNFGVPTGAIKIYFDYFTHSTTGDYFCVDSYVNFRREDIPLYSSIYGIVYLADMLDFRPRISDDGSGFIGGGAVLALPPKPGTRTEVDYTYFLPRVDKISLDIEGKFIVTKGNPGEIASEPETPDLAMHMATITLSPYTYNTNYVNVKKIDNRRYTMRDIGKLERRIENLEFYTSLSLLEQQASSLNVPDEETGLDRFKNGFIVDNFAGHTTGDVSSPDYKSSIDMEMRELRPTFVMDNVNLLETARNNAQRSSQGYQITGDIITLPYTESEFIYQRYASRPENVNPFAIFTFIGTAELNPSSDEWIETTRIPEIINDVEGNFSSVVAAERASGALGTVWNAWQTQWTGTQVTGTTMVRAADWSREDFGLGAGRWMARSSFTAEERALVGATPGGRVLTYELVATQSGQTRTGLNTEVKATFSKEFVNDRVVSTSVVPFIRARKVAFLARGLKLQTIVYPFFDEVNVSRFVTPASRIEFKGMNPNNPLDIGLFDYETNVGQDNEEVSRRFDDNVQTAYNKGDVIYVKRRGSAQYSTPEASVATAVCLLQEVQPGGQTRSVLIIPTKGTFVPGDIITGTISKTEGEVVSYQLSQQGDQLVTNFGGDVAGVFDIPSTDALRFQTGNREFKLIDNLENSDLIATTRAFGNYHAEGVLQTWQATYNSVRNAEVVRTVVTDDRTIVTDERIGRLIRDTGWYDPLAQTFLVQNRGGAFITSVDIWFASIDPVKPVTMQIREVVNGYPGKNILPFSNVTLYPYELRDENQPPGFGLSSNRIEVEGGVWLAPDKPTRFKMKAPVYVQDVGEYCIVLLSNSNNYNVWTSSLGGIDVTSPAPRLISEQPYAGVLFKSQNASTWTAHQNEDLMFRINIAQFQPQGSVEFTNARVDTISLDNNPFFFRAGSPLVRVFQNNHGFYAGAKVRISNVASGTYNGVSSNLLNGLHTIEHVEQDAYVIRLAGANPILTGRTGGSNVRATKNVKFDVLQPIVQFQKFSDTTLNFFTRTTSSRSIHGEQSPEVLSPYIPITANENNEFNTPRMVASVDNEGSSKSFFLRADMTTSNPSLSPVIDSERVSLITVSNRIDNPTFENMNYIDNISGNDFDVYNLLSTTTTEIEFNGNTISSANAGIRDKFKSLRSGKYIRIIGGANDDLITLVTFVAENGSELIVSDTLTNETGEQVQIQVFDNFIDEIASNGSSSAKYLTRKINLSGSAATSTSLNVRFAADIPPGAFVDIYYKIATVGNTTDFNELLWVKMDTAGVTSRLTDQSFTVSNLPEFNAAAVKLVMNSSNSAAVPRIKDLIIIASV